MLKRKKTGSLIVISGPSGSGKGTIIKELLKKNNDLSLSVSMTSRAKRDYEEDGREYFFVTKDCFENKIASGELLEYTCYNGNYYGMLSSNSNNAAVYQTVSFKKNTDYVVKGKVKRLNKRIENLKEELQTYQLSNSRLRNKNDRLKTELEGQKADKQYTEQLENIVKFAITNHMGNLRGGMQIERYGIDKMQDLRLSIDYQPEFNSYIIRVNY